MSEELDALLQQGQGIVDKITMTPADPQDTQDALEAFIAYAQVALSHVVPPEAALIPRAEQEKDLLDGKAVPVHVVENDDGVPVVGDSPKIGELTKARAPEEMSHWVTMDDVEGLDIEPIDYEKYAALSAAQSENDSRQVRSADGIPLLVTQDEVVDALQKCPAGKVATLTFKTQDAVLEMFESLSEDGIKLKLAVPPTPCVYPAEVGPLIALVLKV